MIAINSPLFVVVTFKNIVFLVDKEKSDFLKAGCSFLIVRKLTKEIIAQAIEAHAEDDA